MPNRTIPRTEGCLTEDQIMQRLASTPVSSRRLARAVCAAMDSVRRDLDEGRRAPSYDGAIMAIVVCFRHQLRRKAMSVDEVMAVTFRFDALHRLMHAPEMQQWLNPVPGDDRYIDLHPAVIRAAAVAPLVGPRDFDRDKFFDLLEREARRKSGRGGVLALPDARTKVREENYGAESKY